MLFRSACVQLARPDRLRVCLQVNTSSEPSKYGCEPAQAPALATFIHHQCPHLHLTGLMTIGKLEADPQPAWFQSLAACRAAVAAALCRPENEFDLSMGMSNDMEMSIELGSTNVRVGSAIFGSRDYGIKITDDKGSSDDEHAGGKK